MFRRITSFFRTVFRSRESELRFLEETEDRIRQQLKELEELKVKQQKIKQVAAELMEAQSARMSRAQQQRKENLAASIEALNLIKKDAQHELHRINLEDASDQNIENLLQDKLQELEHRKSKKQRLRNEQKVDLESKQSYSAKFDALLQ